MSENHHLSLFAYDAWSEYYSYAHIYHHWSINEFEFVHSKEYTVIYLNHADNHSLNVC